MINRRTTAFLLQSQVVVAAAMTGIIWFVQRITYPQFLEASAAEFTAFHERYTGSLTPIVAPLMISELALSLASLWFFRRSPLRSLLIPAAVITGALWLTTFLIQVPLHKQLSSGWSEPEIRRLIDTNWIRTALWSVRLALLLVAGARLAAPGRPKGSAHPA